MLLPFVESRHGSLRTFARLTEEFQERSACVLMLRHWLLSFKPAKSIGTKPKGFFEHFLFFTPRGINLNTNNHRPWRLIIHFEPSGPVDLDLLSLILTSKKIS